MNGLVQIIETSPPETDGLDRKLDPKPSGEPLYSGHAPAILVEPGIGSNEKGASALKHKWPTFAPKLIEAAKAWAE